MNKIMVIKLAKPHGQIGSNFIIKNINPIYKYEDRSQKEW